MIRTPHENVATVLVAPRVLPDLELELMTHHLHVWPVRTAPICVDGARQAFQIRRRMVESRQGAWDDAAEWTPVWVSFGTSWAPDGEPLPWEAHRVLWQVLDARGSSVRFRRRLGGVPRLRMPAEAA